MRLASDQRDLHVGGCGDLALVGMSIPTPPRGSSGHGLIVTAPASRNTMLLRQLGRGGATTRQVAGPRQAGGSSAGAPKSVSTCGSTTDPSSRWPFSSSAMIVRPTATAVPLRVCSVSGLPPCSRTRISSRRA